MEQAQARVASIDVEDEGISESYRDQQAAYKQADEDAKEQDPQPKYQTTPPENQDSGVVLPPHAEASTSTHDLPPVDYAAQLGFQMPVHPGPVSFRRHHRCYDWRMTNTDVDFCQNRAWFKAYRKLPPTIIGDADTGMHTVRGIGMVEIRALCGPYMRGTTTIRLMNVLHVPTMVCNGFHLDRMISAVGGRRAEFMPPKIQIYGEHESSLLWMKMDSVMIHQLMLPHMYPWSQFEATALPGYSKCVAFVLDDAQRTWFEGLVR